MLTRVLWVAAAFAVAGTGAMIAGAQTPESAEIRAVSYLSREVPRWRQEHPCYSCHNNGDGTRALIAASRRGLLDPARLGEDVSFLRGPERWALNSDDGGVKDLPLARIQFTSALQELLASGQAETTAMDRAASLVAADQQPDGSWPISAATAIGSPAGYGTTLATAVARRLLSQSRDPVAAAAVARADRWLRGLTIESVMDASAVMYAVGTATDPQAEALRQRALAIFARGQARDGGWGPYVTSQSEPFDTALAMLALRPLRDTNPDVRASLDRARTYLLELQADDGSWPETTRPSGQESYAQRISTTAWALLALLD